MQSVNLSVSSPSVNNQTELKDEKTTNSMNSIGKMVKWIRKDRPLVLKIAVYALAILAVIGLCVSLIGIPLAMKGINEYQAQTKIKSLAEKQKDICRTACKNDTGDAPDANRPSPVMESDASTANPSPFDNLDNIPTFDLKGRMGKTDYIDFLTVDDLPQSIYRGIDHQGRPFFTFKIRDNLKNTVFVETIFQRFPNNRDLWVRGGHEGTMFNSAVIQDKEVKIIGEVLSGKHPRFKLV